MAPLVRICSYYTYGTPYDNWAAGLLASLRTYADDYMCIALPPFSSWRAAVLHKPQFVSGCIRALMQCGYTGILYTDADSVLRRPLPVGDWAGLDFAGHWFLMQGREPELLSGTLYFGITPRAINLVDDWIRATTQFTNHPTPEQAALAAVVDQHKDQIAWRDFGPEMCFIFDHGRTAYPGVEPIVEHFQASRTAIRD